eukprot:Seg1795.5 transcript_id=Seg1795.5/GoldUCD/mRNA.D3Y31 product="hypothetical protein" protein_id=Seg1795.5/GoldUCD/D3Y31
MIINHFLNQNQKELWMVNETETFLHLEQLAIYGATQLTKKEQSCASYHFLAMENQGRSTRKHRPQVRKSVDVNGRLMFLSSVHRISGSESFFLMKVEDFQEPIVVNDEDKMHWWHSLQPFEQVSLGSLKRTTMNKGTVEERKVLTTTAHSTLSVPKLENTAQEIGMNEEKPDENSFKSANGKSRSKFEFVSYTGIVTDCSMINAGIVELDSKIRYDFCSLYRASQKK